MLEVEHALVTVHRLDRSHRFLVGAQMKVECHEGYRLESGASIGFGTCGHDGRYHQHREGEADGDAGDAGDGGFDGEVDVERAPPRCLPTCTVPELPDHGRVTHEADGREVKADDLVLPGNRLAYSCKRGCTLLGAETLTCGTDSIFDNSPPICSCGVRVMVTSMDPVDARGEEAVANYVKLKVFERSDLGTPKHSKDTLNEAKDYETVTKFDYHTGFPSAFYTTETTKEALKDFMTYQDEDTGAVELPGFLDMLGKTWPKEAAALEGRGPQAALDFIKFYLGRSPQTASSSGISLDKEDFLELYRAMVVGIERSVSVRSPGSIGDDFLYLELCGKRSSFFALFAGRKCISVATSQLPRESEDGSCEVNKDSSESCPLCLATLLKRAWAANGSRLLLDRPVDVADLVIDVPMETAEVPSSTYTMRVGLRIEPQ